MKNKLNTLALLLVFFCLSITGCKNLFENIDVYYTVTFNANAGESAVENLPSAITNVVESSKISKPSETPTLSGKVFSGWYKEIGCTTEWNFEVDTVSSDIVLYAGWTIPSAATYTVTFNANAGESAVENLPSAITDIVANSTIKEPTSVPTLTGKTFLKWYKESSCKTEWNFTLDTVNSNLILYAGWTENNVYTINFVTGKESISIPSIRAEQNEVIDIKSYYQNCVLYYLVSNSNSEYRPDNYVLYTESSLSSTSEIDLRNNDCSYTAIADKTYYVKVDQYFTVTFNTNGGQFEDGSTVYSNMYQSGYTLPLNITATYTGKLFSKWTTDEAGKNEYDNNTVLTSDLSLYAQWISVSSYLDGYWVGATDVADVYILDSSTASGIYVSSSGSISDVSIIDGSIKIDSGSNAYSYDETTSIFTVGTSKYKRPSETKTKGSADSLTDYIFSSYYKFSAASDGSLALLYEGENLFTGCWAKDSTNFYMLTSNGCLLHAYALSSLTVADYSVLGGKYYNKAATISGTETLPDAYSFYLGTDGSITVYLWDNEIKGTWYTNNNSFYVDLPDAYFTSYSYKIESKELAIECSNSTTVTSTFNQSNSKGTVSDFTVIENECLGDWFTTYMDVPVGLNITSDGKFTIKQTINGTTSSLQSYYTISNGKIYTYAMRLFDSNVSESSYSYDSSTGSLLYMGIFFNK